MDRLAMANAFAYYIRDDKSENQDINLAVMSGIMEGYFLFDPFTETLTMTERLINILLPDLPKQ
jgi:hypothetical protein